MSLITTVLPVWSLDTYQGITITKKSLSNTLLRNVLMYRSSFRFPNPNCQCNVERRKREEEKKPLRDVLDFLLLVIISSIRYNGEKYSFVSFLCSVPVLSDINECLIPGVCKHAECLNTKGSFRCTCKPGYMLDAARSQCVCELHLTHVLLCTHTLQYTK